MEEVAFSPDRIQIDISHPDKRYKKAETCVSALDVFQKKVFKKRMTLF